MDKERERLRDEEETNDIITVEDLAEQALYSATAPDCCSDAEKAKNMLGMLGANVSDETMYHDAETHMQKAVIDRLDKEYGEFRDNMLQTKTAEQIFYSACPKRTRIRAARSRICMCGVG